MFKKRIILKYIVLAIAFIISVNYFVWSAKPIFSSDDNDFSELLKTSRLFLNNSQFDSAILYINRGLKVTQFEKEWNAYAKNLVNMSIALQMKGNNDSSIYYSSLAATVYIEHNLVDLPLESEINYMKGLYHYYVRAIDSAQFYSNLCYTTCEQVNYDSLLVLVLKLKGNISLYKKKYNEALKYYQSSLMVEKNRDNPSLVNLASLYQNAGIIFFNKSNFDSARHYFLESLKLKENILSENDPKLANGHLNFGLFLLYMGEPGESLEYINKAEEMILTIYGHDYKGLAPLYINKGSVLSSLGNYEEALNYQLLAFDLYKNQLDNDSELFSTLHWNLGLLYNRTGKHLDAIEHFNKSLSGNNDPVQTIRVNRMLAACYYDLNKHAEAQSKYQFAISESKKLSSENILELGYSYFLYGGFCDETGNNDTALISYLRAYEIFKVTFGEKNREISNVLTNISSHYNRTGNYYEALNNSQSALIAFVDDFNDSNYYYNPQYGQLEKDINIFNTLSVKANASHNYYTESKNIKYLKLSLETAVLSIKLFEDIKSSMGKDITKLRITEMAINVYNLAVLGAAELYELTGEMDYFNQCFEYTEKGKAAVLLSTIRKMEALQVGNIPDPVKAKEKKLKNEIVQYENLIFEENQKSLVDSNKVGRIRTKLFKIRFQYDSLMSGLEESFPEYYNLKYNLNVLNHNDIRFKLNPNEAFIEYKLVDSLLFIFIITSDTSKLIRKDVGSGFSNYVWDFVGKMNQLPEMTNVKENSKDFAIKGYELYTTLSLGDPFIGASSHLIIVPNDVLGYLSFDALISQLPSDENHGYRNLDYLIKKYSLSYGYSGTLFFNENKRKSHGRSLLAMAPTYEFNTETKSNYDRNILDLKDYLIPLKHTLDEVNNINRVFKGQLLKGKDATESNFKANSDKYNLLHFAMHTLVNDEDPLSSKLVFSLEGDTIDDGFLNTYEIYNLNLDAELAVLSACKTGVGKISKGEGIMSLARGFLYAGVPGIVMTLWAIEDISSSDIISSFYENLKLGDSKDIALRDAKISYLENANQLQSHPYFWAAYVQIGDNSPLSKPNFTRYYMLAGLIFIGLIIFAYWLKKRARS